LSVTERVKAKFPQIMKIFFPIIWGAHAPRVQVSAPPPKRTSLRFALDVIEINW